MERILKNYQRLIPVTGFIVLLLILGISNYAVIAAGPFSGRFTGYAMGSLQGGAGVTLVQGHFANHHYQMCPNDPAAQWSYGTRITTSSWIGMKDYRDQVYYRNIFYLYGVGDFSCSQGNYWVDIYFGRYRKSGEVCSCPGVSNSVCTVANTNSCSQAINFGRTLKTYTQP